MARTKQEVLDVSKQFGDLLSNLFDEVQVRLYGSYHKGNPHPQSDIDIAVISPDFKDMDYILSLKLLNRLKNQVAMDIEPISMTPDDFKNPQLGSIEYEIVKNSELVYQAPVFFI